MIYALWLYFHLLISFTFHLAMTTQVQSQVISQGYLHQPPYESNINSRFCKDYLRSILGISTSLSSKVGPSHLNYSSPSSTNSSLPRGSLNNITLIPYVLSKKIRRISSSKIMPSFLEAGCISLLNYYWRYDISFNAEESLLRVQIFIFHLTGNAKHTKISVNLNVLLHSTQDSARQRPVVIVLSSFLPRRIYLSVLSYLSRSQRPIHILLTNANTDIIFAETGLRDSDIERIFISVLDKTYNKSLYLSNLINENVFDRTIVLISRKIIKSDFFKYGYFTGFRYNSISSSKSPSRLWLFDNGDQYSTKKLIMKLVMIAVFESDPENINVILGKEHESVLAEQRVFYNGLCIIVGSNNFQALSDRVSIFKKTKFNIDKSRTCSFNIAASPKSLDLQQVYKSISWIHFENISNMTLKLTSERSSSQNETHLLILTTKDIEFSMIVMDSLDLYKEVHILTNISLDRFNKPTFHDSLLISLRPMNINAASDEIQSRSVTNYIGRSSSAVMQTTVYKLKSSATYEIQVNVDDSKVHLLDSVVINPTCLCQRGVNVSLSLDLETWKLFNTWTPSEFMFENQNTKFKKVNQSFVTFNNLTAECSPDQNVDRHKIYGIWHNHKYLLNLPVKFTCLKPYTNAPTRPKIKNNITTSKSTQQPLLIKTGHVFNDSRFINTLQGPLQNKGRLYIQMTQDIINKMSLKDGIQLRDCYVTNKMALAEDLKDSPETNRLFKKIKVIKNGCIDEGSDFYSHVDEDLRPYNHTTLNGLMYRFSFGVDGNSWASLLSLSEQWSLESRIEVYLFCGINRCKIPINSSTKNAKSCQPEKACVENVTFEQIFQYLGIFTIIKAESASTMTFKVCILILLSLLIITILFVLVIFLRRLHKFRLKYKRAPSLHIEAGDWRQPEERVKEIKKPKSKIDYHRLKLLSGTEPSSLRLYSSPSSSLQQLVVDTDRSILLQAGYLSSPSDNKASFSNNHCTTVDPACTSRLLSHSISELCLSHNAPIVVDRALYSWPLSSADRYRRSHHSQPHPRNHSFKNRSSVKRNNCYRLTLSSKLKVSVTFTSATKSFSYSSNAKLSSNRTTVSVGGESASAVSDMPHHKCHKWWSPLSQCSMNNTVIISRN